MKHLLFLFLVCSGWARADYYITVTGAGVKKAKIAVGKIHSLEEGPGDPSIATKVREQVMSDLELVNLFDFVPDAAFTQYDTSKDITQGNYEAWAGLQASFVLRLGYKISGGKLSLEGVFFDVSGRKRIFSTRYQYPIAQYPKLVHALSEDIMKEVTGERGLFFSRILMVCRDLKRKKSPPKEIYVVDPDGRNLIALTQDNTLSLGPSWAPDGKHITYTQYEWRMARGKRKKGTVLKMHNLQTGSRKVLSAKEGMNSGAAWAPGGQKIAMTLSFSGRPEIYLVDPDSPSFPEPLSRSLQWKKVGGQGFQQSSVNLLFDVEPNWSPDGKKLVFSSARTGHPMIYTVDLATKVANQLTFAGVYNASPAWSPKGDRILFAAQRLAEGNFDLYSIDPDGNNLARITMGESMAGGKRKSNTENPSWAPTGRHFVASSNDSGYYAIYVMTADGAIKRRISPADKECSTPAWGPKEG